MDRDDLVLRLRLRTAELVAGPGGLPVDAEHEDVVAAVPDVFPFVPPRVSVDHDRFLGHPHVLQGDRLCVYLDTAQEWHPSHGVVGFLNRLWDWLADAAAGRFDARTALYHPVGGVLHADAGTPTVVVRGLRSARGSMTRHWLHRRSEHRLDLLPAAVAPEDLPLIAVTLPRPLRYGAGTTLTGLCLAVAGVVPAYARHPGAALTQRQRRAVENLLYALARTAAAGPPCAPVHFLLAVPAHENATHHHLVCGRIPAAAMAPLRDKAVAEGALLSPTPDDVGPDIPIEWCTVSEERPTVTSRRDSRRPASAFAGARVVLVGCGGIGSWAGNFIARAGAARLTLCDPAKVAGGLLVRQHYTEDDIGAGKATALARRLALVSDDLQVDVADNVLHLLADDQLPECDVLVDATVSNAVASYLGLVWHSTKEKPLVARMSTDRRTSTLGLLTITRPGDGPAPEEADRLAGRAVAADPGLEPFRCFWEPPGPRDELVPEPGCSIPTFHGSAADLAALAGSLVSLLGPHVATPAPYGSHLVGLPHSDAGFTGRRWLTAPNGDLDSG